MQYEGLSNQEGSLIITPRSGEVPKFGLLVSRILQAMLAEIWGHDWTSNQETQILVLALSIRGCVMLDESLKCPMKVSHTRNKDQDTNPQPVHCAGFLWGRGIKSLHRH